MKKRTAVSSLLLLAVFLIGCVGTEVTGAVVSKYAEPENNLYAISALQPDGSVRDLRVTMFVHNSVDYAHVYKFWCDTSGPYCRADELLYTTEWDAAIQAYIEQRKND